MIEIHFSLNKAGERMHSRKLRIRLPNAVQGKMGSNPKGEAVFVLSSVAHIGTEPSAMHRHSRLPENKNNSRHLYRFSLGSGIIWMKTGCFE